MVLQGQKVLQNAWIPQLGVGQDVLHEKLEVPFLTLNVLLTGLGLEYPLLIQIG